jgi:hypothetical protein
MRFVKLLPVAAGLALAGVANIASAAPTVIALPGVALPAGVPALPDLTLGGGGALKIPGVPALPVPLPLPALPIPTSGGSLAIAGGVGGPAYVVKPTVVVVDGVALPALPAGGLPALPGLPF